MYSILSIVIPQRYAANKVKPATLQKYVVTKKRNASFLQDNALSYCKISASNHLQIRLGDSASSTFPHPITFWPTSSTLSWDLQEVVLFQALYSYTGWAVFCIPCIMEPSFLTSLTRTFFFAHSTTTTHLYTKQVYLYTCLLYTSRCV